MTDPYLETATGGILLSLSPSNGTCPCGTCEFCLEAHCEASAGHCGG